MHRACVTQLGSHVSVYTKREWGAVLGELGAGMKWRRRGPRCGLEFDRGSVRSCYSGRLVKKWNCEDISIRMRQLHDPVQCFYRASSCFLARQEAVRQFFADT